MPQESLPSVVEATRVENSPMSGTESIELLVLDVVPSQLLDDLGPEFVVHRLWSAPDTAEMLEELGPRIRGLVTTWRKGFSAELLDLLPHVEMISVYGTGSEFLDLDAASRRGITVANTQLDGTDSCVADIAIGFAIALARGLFQGDAFVRNGSWNAESFPPTFDFGGQSVGIVGLGFIGRQIAKRAAAFDTALSYYDVKRFSEVNYSYFNDLVSMAEAVRFLFVSCRGGPEANGIINADVLDALGPSGYLVHIAEARYYDYDALVRALQERRIAGAAIDIFPHEPDVRSELRQLTNVILSPHAASTTHELLSRRAELAARNIRAFFTRAPLTSQLV